VKPYWSDDTCALYLGDMREVLPALGVTADCIVADAPYGETSLAWDRWPDGWLDIAADATRSLWCFGSMRMFFEHLDEFKSRKHRDRLVWKISQDIVWEKHNGSGFHADRFKRVHELVTHWYRGPWGSLYHEVPTTPDATARSVRRKFRPPHMGHVEASSYASEDGGPRLMRSVIPVPSMHGRAIHETEKPIGIVSPLIEYACPPGGLVVDPFAGSCSTLDAARSLGRSSIGIELREESAEKAALRLSQMVLEAS